MAPRSLGRLAFLRRVEIPALDSCPTSLPSRARPTRTSHNGKPQWVPHHDPPPLPPGASAFRSRGGAERLFHVRTLEDTETQTAFQIQLWAGRVVCPEPEFSPPPPTAAPQSLNPQTLRERPPHTRVVLALGPVQRHAHAATASKPTDQRRPVLPRTGAGGGGRAVLEGTPASLRGR